MPKRKKTTQTIDAQKALAALRSSAEHRFFPAHSSPMKDASVETLPRLVNADIQWRSRMIEELAAMQMLLMTEMMRPLKERRPDSLSSLVRETRALIKHQLEIVEKAPIGLTAESAKTQVRDALERHALLSAELRKRGLGNLLDSLQRRPGSDKADLPAGIRALMAGQTEPEPQGDTIVTEPSPTIAEEGIVSPAPREMARLGAVVDSAGEERGAKAAGSSAEGVS